MKTRCSISVITGLLALVWMVFGGLVRAQGTYYDAPSTSSYRGYVHTTRLWIPNDVTVIRGVIVLANGANGDQRGRTAETDWQALARAHGFALMGTSLYICQSTADVDAEVPVLLGDLAWYAVASGHPEVTNLPFVLAGWSGGGQIAYGINTKIPERVIAFIVNKGAYYVPEPPSAAALKTPSIFVGGELDVGVGRTGIMDRFEANRPRGALWALAFEENTGHAEGNVDGMFFTLFDHAIRARYPAGVTPLTGPVNLLDLTETNAWLATEPTVSGGLSLSVYPYSDYPGPGAKTNACWLMDADVANLYRGFATYGPAVTVTAVGGPVYAPGQTIQFNVSVDSVAFPGWVSADVYDGAVKLGTVTNGQSSSVYAVRPWGGRGVTAIARDAAGNERTSIPQPFVVSNAVALTNQPATSVLSTNATLNATFSPAWGSYAVTACWGTVNGGSTAANWQHSVVVGTWGGGDPTNFSYTATGLSAATACYFAFCASNAVKQVWATNVLSFTTEATPPNAPSSSGAVLTTLEDAASALAAGNFGYADPNSVALAAVRITSLPALGTLKLNGSTVVSGDLPLTVAAANISNLTYQPPLNGNGTPYTTIGIMVMNASNLWSDFAVMTVNLTSVNDAPTFSGGSVSLNGNTVKTFAAADFPFSDVDAGDTLGAIQVTSLPAHGTLKLGGTPITSVPGAAIPVANIGTLTYTPAPNYIGPDSFKFRVRDATAFSADAAMAITVKATIPVVNGSFETPGAGLGGPWAMFGSPWPVTGLPSNYQQVQAVAGGAFTSTVVGGGTWIALISIDDVPQSSPLAQNLGASVAAGNTLSVTFWLGRDKTNPGAQGVAYFKVDTTLYPMAFDTTLLPADSWQSYTLTKTVTHGGNLSLGFYSTSPRVGGVPTDPHSWLDKISDVTVTNVPVPVFYASWAAANSAGSQTLELDHDHDGVPNGIEYFLGGSANTTGFTALPGVVNTAGTLSVTWTKAADYPGVYGTDYVVQTSTTLTGDWTNEPATGGGVTLTGNHVIYTFPSGAVKFARLKVMGP